MGDRVAVHSVLCQRWPHFGDKPAWVYLGVNGEGGVQVAGDGGGRHLLGTEVDTGKLWLVWHNNDGLSW